MKQQINANNHLATVSRKLSKNKTKKIIKSNDDNTINNFNQQQQQLSSQFQLSPNNNNNSFKPTNTFNNLTRQKSDLTHIRTNYDNSFDSINDLDNDSLSARRAFITSSSFFSKSNKSASKKRSTDLPSTSSSASSSNSNTINRDFSLTGQNKENDDSSSISSFKPYLNSQQQQQQPSSLPSPPAPFGRRNLKSPQLQTTTAAKPFKCSTALDDKNLNLFKKPEIPNKFRSQSRNSEEGFYVRSDQLDQLHSQLNSQLSLNSTNDQNVDLEDNLFYTSNNNNNNNNNHQSEESTNQLIKTKSSLFESFKLKSRKKSVDNLDSNNSPQLPPRNSQMIETNDKKKSSVKLPFVSNKKMNKAGPQIPAPKVPLLARQNVFNNINSIPSNSSSMAEYVTPAMVKKDRNNSIDSSDESSISNNNVISMNKQNKADSKKAKESRQAASNQISNQIKTRDKNEIKMGKDDENKRKSITNLKKIWEHSQKVNDQDRLTTTNNGKLRSSKDRNEFENDDLNEQTNQLKNIIIQLSNVIERIFDEISINDSDQLKDLLMKIDQLRKNFSAVHRFWFHCAASTLQIS